MGNMDELLDMMITDGSPSKISDTIKDLLFSKTSERVSSHRETAAASLFGGNQEQPDIEAEAEVEAEEE
tara:strand:- start:983 stop:1189 length:207 start_codon:yes stop_codon:yes gene_type:complete